MKKFQEKVQEQFNKMCDTGILFRSEITGNQVWDLYLRSFKDEDDPVFRDPESSTHNCNHCKNFIRRYGNILALSEEGVLMSIFDVKIEGEFENPSKVLSDTLKNSKIENVFIETFNDLNNLPYESCSKNSQVFQLGVHKNVKRYTKEEAELYGVVKPNEIRTFDHLFLKIPEAFIDKSGKSVEALMSLHRDAKNVFKRAMDEISMDTLLLVKDLINQGSLLDGETHLYKIEAILPLKEEYDKLPVERRDAWCWKKSHGFPLAKFKNELIGVLCSELSEGEELNKACQAWNKRVDPANYMKAKAPITQKQINEARAFVEENGYEESFIRRFATLDDIKVSEILHSNVGKGEIKSVSMFDDVKATKSRHKRNEFEGVEEMPIDKFMKDVLPGCTSVEALLKNGHEGNMVSLTTANIPDSKPIFKWPNNYSWTFNGNLAGKSQIKESVRTAGGKVDGVLRFSIMWAEDGIDNSDLDAHCKEPTGFEIYYSASRSPYTGGNLDIDITKPQSQMPKGAVENITYPSLQNMKDGVYKFFVHQYAERSSKGFKAEIEFDGEIYSYEYNQPVRGSIQVAEVTLKNGEFTISHKLPESNSSKEIYGLETNTFHKVNLICLSPNHWGENNVGNKHFFFMLDGCKTPNNIRSFHNENLIPELLKHRKVMEVLGSTNMLEPAEKQLSGLGFNATVRDEVILRLKGSHKRVIKVKF